MPLNIFIDIYLMQGTVLDLVGVRHEGSPLSYKSSQSNGWGAGREGEALVQG